MGVGPRVIPQCRSDRPGRRQLGLSRSRRSYGRDERTRVNLWLHGGAPPADGAEVELVLDAFNFTGLTDASPQLDSHRSLGVARVAPARTARR